jgi:hypothetical protein
MLPVRRVAGGDAVMAHRGFDRAVEVVEIVGAAGRMQRARAGHAAAKRLRQAVRQPYVAT